MMLLGAVASPECQWALEITTVTCQELAVLAPEKICGPFTLMPFLGIILDRATMSVQLPEDKLNTLQVHLGLFQHSKTVQDQWSQQSLI